MKSGPLKCEANATTSRAVAGTGGGAHSPPARRADRCRSDCRLWGLVVEHPSRHLDVNGTPERPTYPTRGAASKQHMRNAVINCHGNTTTVQFDTLVGEAMSLSRRPNGPIIALRWSRS